MCIGYLDHNFRCLRVVVNTVWALHLKLSCVASCPPTHNIRWNLYWNCLGKLLQNARYICVHLNKYKWCKMKGWVICDASSHRRRSQVPRRGENIEIRISEKKTFQYRSSSSLLWSRGEGWLARGSALFVGFDTCEQIWLFENHGIQFEWKICINRFRQMRERLEEVNCLYICLFLKLAVLLVG